MVFGVGNVVKSIVVEVAEVLSKDPRTVVFYSRSNNSYVIRRDFQDEYSTIAGETIVSSSRYRKPIVEEGRPLDREAMPARRRDLEHGRGWECSVSNERVVGRSCRLEDNMMAE